VATIVATIVAVSWPISHDELPVAPDHGSDAVSQLFGRPQAAVFYAVQDVFVVPVLDEFLDEFPQFYSIRFQENRSLACVIAVKRIGDNVIRVVVVQIGTRYQVYVLIPYGLVVTFYESGIRPGLVGGVHGLGFPVLETGAHHGIFVCELGRGPLLELNDDHLLLLVFVQACDYKINALGSERNLEFYGNTCVGCNFIVIEHVAHVHHGIGPRQDLVGRGMPAQMVVKGLIDLGVNLVV